MIWTYIGIAVLVLVVLVWIFGWGFFAAILEGLADIISAFFD